jgi:hypothetical protein
LWRRIIKGKEKGKGEKKEEKKRKEEKEKRGKAVEVGLHTVVLNKVIS